MRYILILGLVLLVGCASQPTPLSSAQGEWFDYGEVRGGKGYHPQSKRQLAKLDQHRYLNQELYAAYTMGYEQGRQSYCEQNAYMLGVKGRPYRGVCDQINPFFKQDYQSGRNSRAGSMF